MILIIIIFGGVMLSFPIGAWFAARRSTRRWRQIGVSQRPPRGGYYGPTARLQNRLPLGMSPVANAGDWLSFHLPPRRRSIQCRTPFHSRVVTLSVGVPAPFHSAAVDVFHRGGSR